MTKGQGEIELTSEEDLKMEATIERLKTQKAEVDKSYYEDGMKVGVDWAKDSSYRDLQYMLSFEPPRNVKWARECDNNYSLEYILQDDDLGESFQGIFSEDRTMGADEDGFLNDLSQKWFEGWKHGVHTFWNKVAAKL